MKLKEKVEQGVTNSQLAKLYELMLDNNDEENAQKILDLYEKSVENEFTISFSGHFSAGKSSLINYILDKDVLPKSPIPTSANIVKITSGEGVARIYFNNATTVQYDEPYDIDMIKDYCMDRDTINQIEINTSELILPQNTYLVDTPGIDAADDADRLMTESSLHMIDVLFYVMDYNHVQSEVNLYFLQEIQKQNIPFYIIINQIDKHDEDEIPFTQFHERVNQTFVQWDINPESIFYSSVIDENIENNDLAHIKSYIYNLLDNKDDQVNRIPFATKEIIKDHKQFLQDQYESELIQDDGTQDVDGGSLQSLKNELSELESLEDTFYDHLTEEVNVTLNNAYLMPAQLRELARHFLESQQSDFKVGRFFRVKQKTEEERNTRINMFLTELQKSIESTIQWRLRDKLSEVLREYDVHAEHLFEFIQNINVTYTNEDILRLVNPGATVNGNYVLNYTNEVSANIKSRFRQEINALWAKISDTINCENKQKINELQEKINAYQIQVKTSETNKQLMEQLNKAKAQINDALTINEFDQSQVKQAIAKRHEVVIEEVPVVEEETVDKPVSSRQIVEETDEEKDTLSKQPAIETVVKTIDDIVQSIHELPGFESIVTDLQDKRSRLHDRELTIALFGAFSAGKSSFSNALFGEQILPVSPNPTTAVINRISPVRDQHKHGTVIITLKDSEMLVNDINSMMTNMNVNETDFHQLISQIQKDNLHHHDELNNIYQAYLQALLDGYEEQKNHIGEQITISLDEFANYVTDESKACYVESVDLYYDCHVTRQGITIVDTPGADSINARHTNVAFDYIKYADAILYVTYYNHAITRADRDFLMQLGRVKESFELDKMFFIVNAADLAEDESELNLVLDYVKEQLLEFGIRFPNVYPVSSKQSIEDKIAGLPLNDKMQRFEDEFYTFIHEDLSKLTVQSAIWDMNRAHKTLQNYLNTVNLDQKDRDQFRNELNDKQSQVETSVGQINRDRLEQQLQERIKRQLHYVNERLYIRFHGMFSDHFNPTTVTESGQRGMAQIRKNRNEFIDYVGYELLQEVRAVSLRIESYINELLSQLYEQLEDEIGQIDDTFILANFTAEELHTPQYEQAFVQLDKDVFNPATRLFRGTKAFFEQRERDKMRDAFYDILKSYAQTYIDKNEQTMIENYVKQIEQLIDHMESKLLNDINVIIDNQLAIVDDTIDVELLIDKEQAVSEKITSLN